MKLLDAELATWFKKPAASQQLADVIARLEAADQENSRAAVPEGTARLYEAKGAVYARMRWLLENAEITFEGREATLRRFRLSILSRNGSRARKARTASPA